MEFSAEELAAQLRRPHGDSGQQLAQMMNLRNLPMIIGALKQLAIGDGESVLEVGCGDGGLLGYTLSLAEQIHYTGAELSADMVVAAETFNASFLAAGRARYVLVDQNRLPFDDESFDCALSVNTVYFQADLEGWLGELRRVLSPSGRLCLTFAERQFMQSLSFTKHGFHMVDGDEVVALAKEQGLGLLRRVDQRDLAVSKDGVLVERPFVHLVLGVEG